MGSSSIPHYDKIKVMILLLSLCFLNDFIILILNYVLVCLSACGYVCVQADALRGQKRGSEPPELELQVTVSHLRL